MKTKKVKLIVCLTSKEMDLIRAEAKEKELAISDVVRRIIDMYYSINDFHK